MSEIVTQLKTIIAEELDVNLKVGEIDENASLFEEGLGLDSIAIVELISLVEQHFNFQFSDSELTPNYFSTINNLANFISHKIASKKLETSTTPFIP
ncbi:acyl carrier protein [Iningainema tapete]|uniref:Acyl carrier protein n=1 Tax=Iningainema tapete BLCC-T55 TaxID=2748662 RepID=A0A8J6XJU2_9CYAN|nr:phosphopantetheine-binding protein [Iningainema tapete]MBD2777369.1 acyl carrier protein [Iningainema tapete BLCC-T55]